jgi:Fe-S-cluster-containing dehydrogenase component
MAITQNLILDTDLCTNCRACEMACHFHHQGTFGVAAASIRIDFNSDTGDLRIQIDSNCDNCEQETGPMCVHFCEPGAIRIG